MARREKKKKNKTKRGKSEQIAERSLRRRASENSRPLLRRHAHSLAVYMAIGSNAAAQHNDSLIGNNAGRTP